MSSVSAIIQFAKQIDEELTVHWLEHRMFHGYRTASGAIITLKIRVSRQTIRRALNRMSELGLRKKYMKYGHCYDHYRYGVVK